MASTQYSIFDDVNSLDEEFFTNQTSIESGNTKDAPGSSFKKPSEATTDLETYTCTYQGCSLRFGTIVELQQNKRKGHQKSIGANDGDGSTSTAQPTSQKGPHKCDRSNPSTRKPCNASFSRPYDLTRHEDTIHNARKQKVNCLYCHEVKTFSRNDALTRHVRVVHPEHVDSSSKSQRHVGDGS